MLRISCLPTVCLFLLLLPCFPGQDGEENEQSADVISVWEGDSISITCSMEGSGLGIHLRTSMQPVNVIYVSKLNTSHIFPALANRIKYSMEGGNLRITLHNVQESDSNIYLCVKYVKSKGNHKMLNGKTTIVLVKARTSEVIEQSPLYANPQQGQSVNITCALKSSQEDEKIYLLKTRVQPERVLYISNQETIISPAFANRLEYSKEENKTVITLHNLWKNDSDIYVCAVAMKNFSFLSADGSGTMLLIKEAEQIDCSSSSWGIYTLSIVVALLFSALICCSLYRVDVKKYFQKRKPNVIYEDMSYLSRCNTLVNTNTYVSNN